MAWRAGPLSLSDPLQSAWLLGLLALWAALLFGGFALGRAHGSPARRMPAWARMGSSLALAAAAWSWYAFTRATPIAAFALLVAVGMTLGLLGDLFLARLVPAPGLPEPTLAGIAAFGLGHVAYLAALLSFGGAHGLLGTGPFWAAIAISLVIGLAGWYLVVFRRGQPGALRWAALPYALLLAGMAGVAAGIATGAPAFAGVALGGALFLASDLLLAGELFGGLSFPLLGDVVWLTYGPAQALIVFGAEAALRTLAQAS